MPPTTISTTTVAYSLAEKYQSAIIFLAVVLLISFILVLVYVALKREMCNCFGKKREDDDEGLYELQSDDEWDDLEEKPESDVGEMIPPDELPVGDDVPDVVVTEAYFVAEKKSKKSQMKTMLKKMKKPLKNVRFHAAEKTTLIEESIDSGYGATTTTLAPIKRTDSMESFMSGISTVTTNLEEFGEELSPSRIQVFLQYDPKRWVLIVGAKQAQCLISTSKEKMYWQVHMTLLPFKKDKFKSRYKSTSTPIFNETFEVHNLAAQALNQIAVRYRIYGRTGRTGRKKLAGETEVELGTITQIEGNIIKDWRVLKRRTVEIDKQESDV